MSKLRTAAAAGIAAAFVLAPALALAQDASPDESAQLAAIDAQIAMSDTESGTLDVARTQANSGHMTEALSVLESYLMTHRNSVPVRAQYAEFLCTLDDPAAGRYELAKLAEQGVDSSTSSALQAACGMTPEQALAQIARR